MSRPTRLDESAVQERMQQLKHWKVREGRLCREVKFEDFREAFGFMSRMAMFAEKLDHHPDWSNVYNRVSIRLNTHDVDGLTELDFRFAAEVDRIL